MQTNFDREGERLATVVQLARASAGDRKRLIDEYQRRSEAAFAPTTLRNYRQITAGFIRWCELRGVNHTLPIEPFIVAEYVEDMGGMSCPPKFGH